MTSKNKSDEARAIEYAKSAASYAFCPWEIPRMNQTEFNLEEGLKRKAEGQERAVYNRKALFEYAKGLAWGIAKRQGTVTADDVHELIGPVGSQRLGNAAGALFKGIQWEFTGQWVQSKRPSNHGRMIRIWSLKR